MKKQLRKALAIICALAFAVTGITFTPQSAQAGTSWIQVSKIPSTPKQSFPEYKLGDVTDTDEGGVWSLESAQNQWGSYTARYKNADKVNGFVYDSQAYNNYGGAFLRLRDMFSLGIKDTNNNPLTSGVKYNVAVTITYGGIGDQGTSQQNHYVNFFDNNTNIYDQTVYKTVSPNSTEVFNFQFTPKASDGLNLLVAWSKKESWGDYSEKGTITIDSVAFTPADDFKPVPANEEYQPDDEEDNPWTLEIQNQPDADPSDGDTGTYGAMSYKVDGDADNVASTYLRMDTAGHDDASTGVDQDDPQSWWWWNGGKLNKYADTSSMSEGKTYEGTVHFNYTAPEDPEKPYSPSIRMIIDGDVKTIALEEGDNELPIEQFEFGSELPTIQFNFDLLENGSIIRVTSVDIAQSGDDWVRVPEVEEGVPYGVEVPVDYTNCIDPSLGTTTHRWQLFNGYWGGEGCKLYYDNDLEDYRDPLKIKIGAGNRWDPACAQVKLTNTDAYQELENYTNYYMYYTFTSTKKGTVHINQEGYDPEGLERVDITDDDYDETDGLYHVTFKKIFTVLPESTGNLTMFCTGTTYGPGGVVLEDGDPVPEGTILSDFAITYSRQDNEGWTLVTDSRHPEHQNIDDIVPGTGEYPLLRAYANSYNKGRMSYKAGYNTDGANDVAKMGIRLDQTAGSQISGYSFDETWGLNLQIPNASFYNRNDTNGNELVNGKTYKLRFYYEVELPKNTTMPTASSGLILTQQGYRSDQWARYNIGSTSGTKITKDGLYMAGGSITPKSGSVEDAYIAYEGTKDGGIDFTYDSSWNSGTRPYDDQPWSVMIDFSEFPEGTIIKGIDWEFYTPGYNVYIDGTRANEDAVTEDPGSCYTFPTNATPGFENAVKFVDPDDPTKEYQLGQTVYFDDFNGEDIVVNTVRDETTGVEIREGSTTGPLLKEARVPVGQQYTLPELQGIDHYVYGGQDYNAGDKVGPFTDDPAVIVAIPKATHTIKIVNAEDPTDVFLTVNDFPHGEYYELPDLSQTHDIQYYEYDGEPWDAGEAVGPINSDTEIMAVLTPYHTITIDGDFYTSVRDGGSFTFPSGVEAAKIGYIEVDGSDIFDPGTTIDGVYEDRDYLSIDEMTLSPKPGACIYLNDTDQVNRRGIAFGTEFRLFSQKGAIIDYQEYENVYKSDCFKLGTIMTTQEEFIDYFEETLDLAQVAKAQQDKRYVFNINNNCTFCDVEFDDQDYAEYRAGIINLNDYNITRNFIARSYGYVETANGTVTDVVYADYSDVRSIKQVATNLKAKPAYYNNIPKWKRDIIDWCAAFDD